MKLQIVNQYKYLGVIFSTGLTFSYAHEDMANRAKKGVVGILKLLWTLGDQSPKLFFKLFDCQIQPMLTYRSEVWGLIADNRIIERIRTKCFIICTVTTKTTEPPLFASHCIDTDMDMFGKTRVFLFFSRVSVFV